MSTATDYQCSLIAHAKDTTTQKISFTDALYGIISGKWATQVEAVKAAYDFGGKKSAATPKKLLPGILFSGTFTERNAEKLIQHSGLICADLDELGDKLIAVKEQLTTDTHVLAAFVSPTGTGIKAVFRCDSSRPHDDSFHALEAYVHANFGLNIDPACSDVCRICFVSHDPEAFVATDAQVLPYPVFEPKPVKEFILPPRDGRNGSHDLAPGDDFNQQGTDDVPTILEKHGWTHVRGKYWCRPGKQGDVSASWGHFPNTLRVFSSSPETGFPSNRKGFDPFAIYTYLECHGDFTAAARSLAQKGYGTPTKSRQQHNMDRIAGAVESNPVASIPTNTLNQRKPSEFHLVQSTDQTSLLGNRYLNRGDGLVISGPSGCGKSSMQTQMAARWALGKDFHGIKPANPLRSLIIQSEDSDGDIAEVWASLNHVLAHTDEDRTLLDERVRIVTDRVNRGLSFISSLKKHVAEFNPDLVWINPLQAFIDGDVTQSKDIGKFLRKGLNGLNEPAGFGYVLIHHTTKPPTGKDRHERLWHEVMYDMAGGAEIINWARAIISLRPLENPGDFSLRLAKRGKRAGVVKSVDQGAGEVDIPVTEIPIRHATGKLPSGIPVIYWESREDVSEENKPKKKAGRAPKYLFINFKGSLPKKNELGKPYNQIAQACLSGGVPKGSVYEVIERWAADGDLEILRPDTGPAIYRSSL